jgi:hypothetical protein
MPDSSSARDTVSQYLRNEMGREKELVGVLVGRGEDVILRRAVKGFAAAVGSFHLVKK